MDALSSLVYFLPELVILGGAFVCFILDCILKKKKWLPFVALGVLLISGAFTVFPEKPMELFFGFFHLDAFTVFLRLFIVGTVAITILLSIHYAPLNNENEGEYYSLLLLIAFALNVLAGAVNLLMIFMAVEFVSLLSYILVGFLKKDAYSKEASIKYFLFGSLASGIMLYGMSLLFGASGSIALVDIYKIVTSEVYFGVSLVGFLLFLAGLGFKIAAAPFHMWAPDVYEAAPTPITAFLTVAPKALGFAVLIRILLMAFSAMSWNWHDAIAVLSILTMSLGNIIAISQNNMKRLLAYSSIAQAGYILMGIAVLNGVGLHGVVIYLIAYAFTNLGAFAIVIAASSHFGNDRVEEYSGLAGRNPFLAAALTIFLLSLTGIPPLAGFIGKFFVFSAAIQEGFLVLAVAAAINSAIAAFYYFKVIRLMYLVPASSSGELALTKPVHLAIVILLLGTVLIGILPAYPIEVVQGLFINT